MYISYKQYITYKHIQKITPLTLAILLFPKELKDILRIRRTFFKNS